MGIEIVYAKPDPKVGMIGYGFISRLPMHRHLLICVGGKPIWPWRATMFWHNKRQKPGRRKLRMRGTSRRR